MQEQLVSAITALVSVLTSIDTRLARIETLSKRAVGLELGDRKREKHMDSLLQEIRDTAQANTNATKAAVETIERLAAAVEDKLDEGEVEEAKEMLAAIRQNAETLGKAVTDNTFQPSQQP